MTIAPHDRTKLLALARRSIEAGLATGRLAPRPQLCESPSLSATRATFVTLHTNDDLRGCCGSIDPRFALVEDVWRNAWAAAFADPRFPSLEPAEYPRLALHISVLSPLEKVSASNEDDLLALLRPGQDGLLLQLGAARATFLPSVWDSLPNPFDFLGQLKLKAGWRSDFWSPQIEVWRYGTESFGEE